MGGTDVKRSSMNTLLTPLAQHSIDSPLVFCGVVLPRHLSVLTKRASMPPIGSANEARLLEK